MATSAIKRTNKQRGKGGDAKKTSLSGRNKSSAKKSKSRKSGSTTATNGKRTRDTTVAEERASSEGELSDEDMAYFNEAELKEFGFLSNMNAESLSNQEKGKRKKKQSKSEDISRAKQNSNNSSSDDDDDVSDDALAAYEEAPRKGEWNKREEQHGRLGLPIKLPDGRVQRGAVLETNMESSDEEEDEETKLQAKQKEQREKERREKRIAKEEAALAAQQGLSSKKERLASIAQTILADPEAQISKLKVLREMSQDPNEKTRKLVYLTQMAVYKDIAPGYRIRELTEQEQAVKVSAELRKLRKYEETLVFYYRTYIDSLLREMKGGSDMDTSPGSMSYIVTKCICSLLSHLSHFNFRSELIKAIMQRLGARRWSEVSIMAQEVVITLFKEDASGEISLEIVKEITHMVKKRDYNVHPQVLATFFHLRLRDELQKPTDDDASSNSKDKKRKKDKVHLTKRERKRRRVQKEVESEMREAEAEYTREERERMYNETLKMVFVTYFRVLKQGNASPLLPAVLEGLAKFAHLISVDYFEDLLALLKKIMLHYHPDYKPDEQTLNDKKGKRRHAKLIGGEQATDASNATSATGVNDIQGQSETHDQNGDAVRMPLLCLITIAQILSGHGEALSYDLKEFYALLYTLLFPIAMKASASEIIHDEYNNQQSQKTHQRKSTNSDDKTEKATRAATDTELVMRGLDVLLLQRKHIPVERVGAFLKRMAMVSLHMSPVMATEVLDRIRTVMTRRQQLDALLSDEEGRMGNGVYQATLDDPDLCNPMATNLWELALLKDHYDPKVRQMTNTLLQLRSTSHHNASRTHHSTSRS
ncbi:CBF/Mak21 family-domain-containing protein [Syncephalis plumigaleata]|nr:CBF/Mak21 family-domain-containing protein [Syncephalis plumigaleata]